MNNSEHAALFEEYTAIMKKEALFNMACERFAVEPFAVNKATCIIAEFAKASILQRGWCHAYGLTSNRTVAYESVAAHSYLVMGMLDRALITAYGKNYEHFLETHGGYTYRELMEAARIHDLPENSFGDWLDNGNSDLDKKAQLETEYYNHLEGDYARIEAYFISSVRRILSEMENRDEKSHSVGRLLYTADKYALPITALTYDLKVKEAKANGIESEAITPFMCNDSTIASKRDYEEMSLCDDQTDGYHKASEMFTADILHIRQLRQYDDTGFFTAVLVMYTLMVNGHWYKWRENDYKIKAEMLRPPP